MKEVDLIPVESSNVSFVGHDQNAGLFVVFHGQRPYLFEGCDETVLDALLAAKSKGAWVNQHLTPMGGVEIEASIVTDIGKGMRLNLEEFTVAEFQRVVAMSQELNEGQENPIENPYFILPREAPEQFFVDVTEWLKEVEVNPDTTLGFGEEGRIVRVCEAMFTLQYDDGSEGQPIVIKDEVKALPPEVESLKHKRGDNPRAMVSIEDPKDSTPVKHYLYAALVATQSFQKNVGLEPIAFLPYDAPAEARALLEKAGFTIDAGKAQPPPKKLDVGVHIKAA